MKISIEEVTNWADKNGCQFDPERLCQETFLNGEFDLMSCLPMSEQDEMLEHRGLSDEQWDAKTVEMFSRPDFSIEKSVNSDFEYRPINGFCNSIVGRVVLGKYMAVHGIMFGELY